MLPITGGTSTIPDQYPTPDSFAPQPMPPEVVAENIVRWAGTSEDTLRRMQQMGPRKFLMAQSQEKNSPQEAKVIGEAASTRYFLTDTLAHFQTGMFVHDPNLYGLTVAIEQELRTGNLTLNDLGGNVALVGSGSTYAEAMVCQFRMQISDPVSYVLNGRRAIDLIKSDGFTRDEVKEVRGEIITATTPVPVPLEHNRRLIAIEPNMHIPEHRRSIEIATYSFPDLDVQPLPFQQALARLKDGDLSFLMINRFDPEAIWGKDWSNIAKTHELTKNGKGSLKQDLLMQTFRTSARAKVLESLKLWNRVLRPGGKIYLSVGWGNTEADYLERYVFMDLVNEMISDPTNPLSLTVLSSRNAVVNRDPTKDGYGQERQRVILTRNDGRRQQPTQRSRQRTSGRR